MTNTSAHSAPQTESTRTIEAVSIFVSKWAPPNARPQFITDLGWLISAVGKDIVSAATGVQK